MKKKTGRRQEGLFERPPGSGVWWINYYVNGKQHREKAGRRSDAVALYQKRKADSRRKLKLPELVPGNAVHLAHLSSHGSRARQDAPSDERDYVTRHEISVSNSAPAMPIRSHRRKLTSISPSVCKTNATANRYRSYISLAYRLGMENDKVQSNPARLVRMRKEHNARFASSLGKSMTGS